MPDRLYVKFKPNKPPTKLVKAENWGIDVATTKAIIQDTGPKIHQ